MKPLRLLPLISMLFLIAPVANATNPTNEGNKRDNREAGVVSGSSGHAMGQKIKNGPRSTLLVDDFPGWNRKQAISINNAMVDGSTALTNFPVLITLDHLDPEVVDGGSNSALNGGGDLRFSSDAAGNNRLAVEVVEFVTSATAGNRRCQIWVKIPSLSATADTTIYVWYNKAGESQPAATDSYGSRAVWSDFEAVWHMEDDPSAAGPQILDATGNGHDLTSSGSMTSSDVVSGAIGNAIAFDGSNDRFALASNAIISNGSYTITSYVNWSGSNSYNAVVANASPWSGIWINNSNGGRAVYSDGNQRFSNSSTVPANTTVKVDFVVTGGDSQHFFDGVADATSTVAISSGNFAYVGSESTSGGFLTGWLDEIRVSPVSRTASWLKTEHNNQNNPAGFASKGSPESAGGDTQDPTAATLSSTGKTDTTVDLGWSGATDNVAVTGYKIYRDGALEATLGNVSSHQLTGLTAATAYQFKIRALDAAGNESVDSNVVNVTTDAASGGSAQNLLDTSTWTVGTGSVTGFSKNGTDAENVRELGTDPHGNQSVLWKAVPDAASDADGGWYSSYHDIDHTKTYRYSVWVKKTNSNDGEIYFGPRTENAAGDDYTTLKLDGTVRDNSYFMDLSALPQLDKWFLLIGFVHESAHTGTTSTGGIYDQATGSKLQGLEDFKFSTDAAQLRHRAYLYYDTNTADRLFLFDPTIYEVNGQEPTIAELLNPGGADTQDPTAATLSSTGHTDTTVDLNWSGATDNVAVTGYKVYRDGALEATLGNVISHQLTGLTASTAYQFKLRALDAAGNESVDSNVVNVTTDAAYGGSAQNLLDTSTWTVGTGSVTGFSKNGTDAENVRELGTDPHGNQSVLWKAVPDASNDADGGWNSSYHDIEHTKTYRYSVWVKKTNSNDGEIYFGLRSRNAAEDTYTTLKLDGTVRDNSYFMDLSALPQLDKWFLLIGFVHESSYTGTTSTGGIYDQATGNKLQGLEDFKFTTNAAKLLHRSYLYYDTNTADRLYLYAPTIYEVNGQEPTIAELLNPGGSGTNEWTTSTHGVEFNSSGNANGNVGIGTTAQANYRLAVDGKIHTKEVKVDLDGWADYVFAKGYELPSLEEIRRHITEKGHLINIPSAAEVAANGIELGEMDRLLLEKIEELTLHILEQHRLQGELEREIQELEDKVSTTKK